LKAAICGCKCLNSISDSFALSLYFFAGSIFYDRSNDDLGKYKRVCLVIYKPDQFTRQLLSVFSTCVVRDRTRVYSTQRIILYTVREMHQSGRQKSAVLGQLTGTLFSSQVWHANYAFRIKNRSRELCTPRTLVPAYFPQIFYRHHCSGISHYADLIEDSG